MAYADVILATPGLKSYWKLDETSGNFIDTKNVAAGVPAVDSGTLTRGVAAAVDAGSAIQFNAVAGIRRIEFGDVYDFVGRVPYSVELWVKPTAVPTGERRVIAKEDTGRFDGWALLSQADGSFRYARREVNNHNYALVGTPTLNAWNHIVVVYDGTSMLTYLNGVLVTTLGSTLSQQNTTGICQLAGVGDWFGVLDEVAIYDVALDLATVGKHYDYTSQAVSGPVGKKGTKVVTASGAGIPKNATKDVPFTVANMDGTVADVLLGLYVQHTNVADLDVSLIAPSGASAHIFDNRGGTGDDIGTRETLCVFDDGAVTAIAAGAAPYAGTYRPETAFSGLDGQTPNGVWKLRFVNSGSSDGTLAVATLLLGTNSVESIGGPPAVLTGQLWPR